MKRRKIKIIKYRDRLLALLRHPFFWVLTIFGNATILVGSLFLFVSESKYLKINFLDCILWSTGIVTTIGYGDYRAITSEGKVTVLILMLVGTFFVWAYMGFLVTALISPELGAIEREVEDVEREIRQLKSEEESSAPTKSLT